MIGKKEEERQRFLRLAKSKKEEFIEREESEREKKRIAEAEANEKARRKTDTEREIVEKLPRREGKLRGLFVNGRQAVCSLYESGLMIKNALKSDKYDLDYIEISRDQVLKNYNFKGNYDFYVINWHHITLPIKKEYLRILPGLKVGIILETNENRPFDAFPRDIFTTHMVIDPTMRKSEGIYPFPRPLEKATNLKLLLNDDVPVIGSFGLYTPGKSFDEIIKIYVDNGKEAIIRINIPFATYTLISEKETKEYANYLRKLCTPNIKLEVTHTFMNKQEIISWCSENWANVFFYHRNQAGLCATADQAASSHRALIVNNCPSAFRHLYKYIDYYPHQSFEQLMESTLPGVEQMNKDWSSENFNLTFEGLLKEKGLL